MYNSEMGKGHLPTRTETVKQRRPGKGLNASQHRATGVLPTVCSKSPSNMGIVVGSWDAFPMVTLKVGPKNCLNSFISRHVEMRTDPANTD